MSHCLQSCFKVATMALWYWWLLFCSKQGQHGQHESLLWLSMTSFTSVCLCVQTHFGANENTKVFLKLIQKASVSFSFFRGFLQGADRWWVCWRQRAKPWSLESACSVFYNRTTASLPVTSQCYTTVSVKNLLLYSSEPAVWIPVQRFLLI